MTALLVSVVCLAGCEESKPATRAPLRPLVYTEVPEITPEAAAVREERIMRGLVEGAQGDGRWGSLESNAVVPDYESGDALGRAIVKALVERDARVWDSIFVRPEPYAGLVGLEPQEAEDFVDEIQGESSQTWRLFEPEPASQAPVGGLATIFDFEALELGEPRGLDGKPAEAPSEAVQFWNSTLRLSYKRQKATFEFRIPKILRVASAPRKKTLALASAIRAPDKLEVLFDAGLHLKPEMLRSGEYPMPIQVGTFWSYRRVRRDEARVDPLLADYSHATEVIVDVVSVDRYETLRLVKMRRSYNDSELTKVDQWWLVTPRRMDLCDQRCRSNVEDLSLMLDYLASRTPALIFPASTGSWPEGSSEFVATSVESVEVPAGVFTAALAIEGQGPLGLFDRRLRATQTRFLAVGQGIVRRDIGQGDEAIVEELVDYRIMP